MAYLSNAFNRAALAYNAGFEAKQRDVDIGDNPYRYGSFQWVEWFYGWLDRDQEIFAGKRGVVNENKGC